MLGYRFPETISLLSFLPWKGIETPCFLEDRKMYSRCMMDKKKTLIFPQPQLNQPVSKDCKIVPLSQKFSYDGEKKENLCYTYPKPPMDFKHCRLSPILEQT